MQENPDTRFAGAAALKAAGRKEVSRHSLKLSPSESHMFKNVSQELCPSDGTSQRTTAVPAKAPGAAWLSMTPTTLLSGRDEPASG